MYEEAHNIGDMENLESKDPFVLINIVPPPLRKKLASLKHFCLLFFSHFYHCEWHHLSPLKTTFSLTHTHTGFDLSDSELRSQCKSIHANSEFPSQSLSPYVPSEKEVPVILVCQCATNSPLIGES